MKKFRTERQRLMWIIEFLNQDIDNLSAGDFLKMLVELPQNIKNIRVNIWKDDGRDRYEIRGYPLVEDTPLARKGVKSIQGRLKRFLETILKEKDYCEMRELKEGEIVETGDSTKNRVLGIPFYDIPKGAKEQTIYRENSGRCKKENYYFSERFLLKKQLSTVAVDMGGFMLIHNLESITLNTS